MHIKQEDKNGILKCFISGDVDINTAVQLKKTFDRILSQKKDRIVLNFKDVTYIDSSGLATLVEIFKQLRSYGGKLKLTNLSTKIKNLFEITKLDKLFDILSDDEEAERALAT